MMITTLKGLIFITTAMLGGWLAFQLLGIIWIFFQNLFSSQYTPYDKYERNIGAFKFLGIIAAILFVLFISWMFGEALNQINKSL